MMGVGLRNCQYSVHLIIKDIVGFSGLWHPNPNVLFACVD